MTGCMGFHEIVPDQQHSENWKSVVINTGTSQSTLQDIKVPEYGGGYVYNGDSPATTNRYIFWRVTDDTVQLWEESLNLDLTHNHTHLRIVGLPILEGISVYERNHQQVVLLVSTIASTHCFTLPHPDTVHHHSSNSSNHPSVLRDLDQSNLREVHSMRLLSSPAVEGGRVHTACSAVVQDTAVFMFGQPSAALLLLTMRTAPVGAGNVMAAGTSTAADVFLVKNTSLVNRLFMGFVPGMFRGGEGSDVINSLSSVTMQASAGGEVQMFGVGVCGDGRVRVWCVARRECVLIHDTLEDTAETASRNTLTGERHVLVCRSVAPGVAMMAVRLSFVEKQLLLLYRLHLQQPAGAAAGGAAPVVAATPALSHLRTLYPPQHQLVDMDLTSTHVWTLWTDADNDNQLLYSPLECSGSSSPGLVPAILSPSPPKSVPNTDPSLDPREVYLQQLFQPYAFSDNTIARAMAMYRGSSTAAGSATTHPGGLRGQLEAVLQAHIETKITPETTEDDLYDLTLDTYEKFYSHTLQYQQVGQKAVGLSCGGGDGGVAVVRRQSVAWVAAVDGVEAVVAAAVATPHIHDLTQVVVQCGVSCVLKGDTATAASVAGVLRCVAVIRSLIDSEVAAAFMLDMSHHRHPEVVAEDVATSLLGQVVGGDEVAAIISAAVCGVPSFTTGLMLLVQALNFDTNATSPDALHAALNNKTDDTNAENMDQESSDTSGSGVVVGSCNGRGRLWCGLVAASLHQLASSRLQLCRDLLVLQQAALRLAQLCQLSPDSVGQLRASIVQDTVLVTRAYHALLCLTRAPAVQPTQQQLHSIRRVLAALGLQENGPATPKTATVAAHSTALFAVLRQGSCPTAPSPMGAWLRSACESVQCITKEAWPLQDRSGGTALLEGLVFGGQGEAALHYIRQVCGWCEWSLCSRHFLLGLCLVLQGQYRKAARLLQEAGEGCATEELLGERVGGGGGPDNARVNYTLRLVRLFEVFQQPGLAVRLATTALSVCHQSAPQLSQLYAVLFKHHLALGHHDEAFTALLANPDPGPQRACLRQLLVTLHQRGCLTTLVNYQYGGLLSEVVTILENRARSADILLNNYYHLLYAFHVQKHNYKRAASVMYECGQRLSTEASSHEGLKQQLKCYLACINCLKLLPKDMAWILKPTPGLIAVEGGQEGEDCAADVGSGNKRCSAGERVTRTSASSSSSSRRKQRSSAVQVLELQLIDREYQLVHARLQLHSVSGAAAALPHTTVGSCSDAHSTISLLCHARLYREALRLSRLFDLSIAPVVQSLAAACAVADNAGDKLPHHAWLHLNAGDNVGGDWWDLLRELMATEDTKKSGSSRGSVLHSAVTATLMDRGHALPPWLMEQYTSRDCGGLLQLQLRYGRLDEAVTLGLRLMEAVTTGNNCAQVGLLGPVHATRESVWLPYTALDHLLLELRENTQHTYYNKALHQLESKIHSYQTELKRVSSDYVKLKQQR